MFKFNFFPEPEAEISKETTKENQNDKIALRRAERITIESEKYDEIVDKIENVEVFTSECEEIAISYIDIATIQILGGDLEVAGDKNSDLVNGVYEGGLKIWEATEDVLNYLIKSSEIALSGKKCLDLGCGSGILGIYAVKKSGIVTFQDYNSEVIHNLTIPNVIVNIEESEDLTKEDFWKQSFWSGDWDDFTAQNEDKFDVILTAETIYNPDYYQKLLNLFKNRLATYGVIYLACKVFYFGCNGNLRDFEKLLETDGSFSYKTVLKVEKDVFREVLEIKFKK